MARDYGAETVVNVLRQTLQSYLEAQYHIRNESLIEERRRLFETPGVIHQVPFVESTPVYEPGTAYADLSIPDEAKRILSELSSLSVGVPRKPYVHQSRALEAFLGRDEDIVIATGTGSGKTESFLMPIIGTLAMEASSRPHAARLTGCRALLLYPMNALVNDQLARVRRIFGNEDVAKRLAEGRGRMVRFGRYTSRTPYPGPRIDKRDTSHIEPMFEEFYLRYANDAAVRARLDALGRWPSKDMVGFYGAHHIRQAQVQTGRREGTMTTHRNWGKRLLTQPNDRELFTRHEMQLQCPDLLITNYSMLEYMLMRPIERPIFDQTRGWLHSDPGNRLTIVLDEAHMYRGAAGAEVALLLRRLHGRLGVSRERVQYILTSASLGEDPQAEEATRRFARELTGIAPSTGSTISLVRGVREVRKGHRAGTAAEARALATVRLVDVQEHAVNPTAARSAVNQLADDLGWPSPASDESDLPAYLYDRLTNFGPAETLIREISGAACELAELGSALFPDARITDDERGRATEALLALCNLAGREIDGQLRILLPARLHLFYRGVPALYACINPECDIRLDVSRQRGQHLLGRLYTDPKVRCECTLRGRVYELLTHRDCGAAFLRAYMRGEDGDFLWHEPIAEVGAEGAGEFIQLELLVESPPHPMESDQAAKLWIDISTGRILRREPTETEEPDRFLIAYAPTSAVQRQDGPARRAFKRCPACTKSWQGRSKIMDLGTKGEQPFANLVKAQIIVQPPKVQPSPAAPNGGRKSLLFSDGRQKAARLARDIPREVELDSFRQTIILAADELKRAARTPTLNRSLYFGFLGIVQNHHLRFFDGDSASALQRHLRELEYHFDGSWIDAANENWDVRPPNGYYEALLRQLGSTHYSLTAATIAYVEPHRASKLRANLQSVGAGLSDESLEALSIVWIGDMLGRYAFDIDLPQSVRSAAAGYDPKAGNGKFSSGIRRWLRTGPGLDETAILALESQLQSQLTTPAPAGYYLNPNLLKLTIALHDRWHQCSDCTDVLPVTVSGHCGNCGSTNVMPIEPSASEYIRARKGFWREPVELALAGERHPVHITAEEHTAQLSNRDASDVYATTEKYELRFQDVHVGEDDYSVDVLSSTTTMEVGVDIGSLVAVGLRNVPPQRENYQQRAGRAGRRGSAISTVITYAQGGPHDSYYFQHPEEIVAGDPRSPSVKVDNEKIARRHLNAFLLQSFFHDVVETAHSTQTGMLQKALGSTLDFFTSTGPATLSAFEDWVDARVHAEGGDLTSLVREWLPGVLTPDPAAWVRDGARLLVNRLNADCADILKIRGSANATDDLEGTKAEFLEFLFDRGYLPSYAFPTDLAEFRVERIVQDNKRRRVAVLERPQQSIRQALSEYAPGRLLVIDKRTYRSGGVAASFSEDDRKRAVPLFENARPYVYCRVCSYVQDTSAGAAAPDQCPVCGLAEIRTHEFIEPQVFSPEGGRAVDDTDRDQEYTYATSAQFPVPVGQESISTWREFGRNGKHAQARDQRLVMVNMGDQHTGAGFEVCEQCGFAVIAGNAPTGSHRVPFQVLGPTTCSGAFRPVFLGTEFRSDLLIVRFTFNDPIATNMRASGVRGAIEDALRTLSEGLLLRASRYLDIDASEFSVGFRVVPLDAEGKLAADVFLYDTLAGGAGYADRIGGVIEEVLLQTLADLEGCSCDRSCQNCLRHYHNRFWHERLDRHLAASVLRYVLLGEFPSTGDLPAQSDELLPLCRMLELDGYHCEMGTQLNGVLVPLLVRGDNGSVAVGTYSALLDDQSLSFEHPLQSHLDQQDEIHLRLVDSYRVSRNLPAAYSLVKDAVGPVRS